VALVFAPTLSFGFLPGDDQLDVTQNPHVLGGLTWANVQWALTSATLPYWQPVSRLSHLVDVEIFGFAAGGHHATNVLVHAVNTLLVWWLCATATGARWRAAVVAALFAVHPLHVESVVWVAERKDVLSTLFALLTLVAYVGYVRRPGVGRYSVMVGWFALALMAKPMTVTVPVVLLLLDIWPLGRAPGAVAEARLPWRSLLIEKIPLCLMAGALAVGTILAERGSAVMPTLTTLPWRLRLATAITAYVAYLGQVLWPVHLAAFYPRDWSPSVGLVALDGAGLVAMTAGVLLMRRTRPYLLVGWFWFVVTLVPVIGIVQSGEQAMADRFMYVPLLGVSIAAVWGLSDWATSATRQTGLVLVTGAGILACLVLGRAQVEVWQDDVSLWRHAVAVTDHNYLAEDRLGLALATDRDWTGARAAYAAALRDAPTGEPDFAGLVHTNMADTLAREGRSTEAVAEYQMALELNPNSADAESDLGSMLVTLNRPAEAEPHYLRALHLRPDFAEAENGLGAALALDGQTTAAIAHYRAAVALNPALAMAHTNLAMALVAAGTTREAVVELLTAIRLDPTHAPWEFNVGALLMREGLPEDAAPHFTAALDLDPTFERARQALESIAAIPR
jgi:tetratricopeptide (TPR) repeat protein